MSASEIVLRMESVLRGADVLIIVPPFGDLDRPSLAAHLLQGVARRAGHDVAILYANILLTAVFGAENYRSICKSAATQMLGDRLFARAAYGSCPLGEGVEELASFAMIVGDGFREGQAPGLPFPQELPLPLDTLRELETLVPSWLDTVAACIAQFPVRVVGCTTTFEQTAASIAILAHIKRLSPNIVTIIGGANCEGAMADGIASLDPSRQVIDFIFSGESEGTFPAFLDSLNSGEVPANRIIYGQPLPNLDDLPIADFADYFAQRRDFLPTLGEPRQSVILPYESSRGCWWGQKHHCTFCGLNGESMSFRRKSPDKVITELRELVSRYSCQMVAMSDNIMPHEYFRTVLPVLAADPLPVPIFYEQKSNLTLNDVVLLKKAGITEIQPGIESLSSGLLKLMDKGVSSRQNIALLRYARSVGVKIFWNLLWGFPNDQLDDYKKALEILPLLFHLEPPQALCHVIVDRFSPYFSDPVRYRITNIRPLAGYATVLPKDADVEKIAYHFVGEYASGCYEDLGLIQSIAHEVDHWRSMWNGLRKRPVLSLTRRQDQYTLVDTRDLHPTRRVQEFDKATASLLMSARPYARGHDAKIDLAVDQGIGIVLDSWYEPLMTAAPETMAELTANGRQRETENSELLPTLNGFPPLQILKSSSLAPVMTVGPHDS
jgi:ribosomal peptide maturation radical SAM protein 1